MDNFLWGGKFFGGKLFRTLGEFARISVRCSFYLTYFFFGDSILRVKMLRVITVWSISSGFELFKRSSHGGQSAVEVEPVFPESLIKRSDIKNKKKYFFRLKVRSNFKT